MRVGPGVPVSGTIFEASPQPTPYSGALSIIKASHIGSGIQLSGAFTTLRGVYGQPIATMTAGSSYGIIYGLQFQPIIGPGGSGTSVYSLIGAYVGYGISSYLATITEALGIDIAPPYLIGAAWTVTTSYGLRVGNAGNSARIQDAYGLKIEDMTLNTGFRRLLEVGPATPNLRVEGGAPAANVSQVLIAVNNGAVVLRRVEIGAADSAGVGYRSLRVLN